MANLFQKITESKETLAKYLLKCCDNPPLWMQWRYVWDMWKAR